jgi:hypothetical protein
MEVALVDFGIAKDALDGELCPNNGILDIWNELDQDEDEIEEHVDSCRRVGKLLKGVVCVLLLVCSRRSAVLNGVRECFSNTE